MKGTQMRQLTHSICLGSARIVSLALISVICSTMTFGETDRVPHKRLAMVVNAFFAGPEAGLYTIMSDGSAIRKLVSFPASPHGGGYPRWSPDGEKIVFDAEFNGNDEIYVINSDGTNLQQLTFDAAPDRDPVWSPDGDMIAFSSDRGTSYDIFVMNADGSNITDLTNSSDSDEYVTDWSPDGSQIAFTSYQHSGGPPDSWIMNADGSGQTNLTPHTNVYGFGGGRWLPDGSKLIFGSDRLGDGDLFMMNPDGTEITDLTNSPGLDYGGTSWSHRTPGSFEVAFSSRRSGFSGLYTMNSDGTHQSAILLTTTLDNLYIDAWR